MRTGPGHCDHQVSGAGLGCGHTGSVRRAPGWVYQVVPLVLGSVAMPAKKGSEWTAAQHQRLEELMAERPKPADGKTAYWTAIAAELPDPPRTRRAAENRATELKLREKIERRQRGLHGTAPFGRTTPVPCSARTGRARTQNLLLRIPTWRAPSTTSPIPPESALLQQQHGSGSE